MGYKQCHGQGDDVATTKAILRHEKKMTRGETRTTPAVPISVGMGRLEAKDMQHQPPDSGKGWDDVDNKNG